MYYHFMIKKRREQYTKVPTKNKFIFRTISILEHKKYIDLLENIYFTTI